MTEVLLPSHRYFSSAEPSGRRNTLKGVFKRLTQSNSRYVMNESKMKPLVYVDINFGKGKVGRIALFPGDDPQALAENFSR